MNDIWHAWSNCRLIHPHSHPFNSPLAIIVDGLPLQLSPEGGLWPPSPWAAGDVWPGQSWGIPEPCHEPTLDARSLCQDGCHQGPPAPAAKGSQEFLQFFSSVFFIEYKNSDSCKKQGIELLANTDTVSLNMHMYKDTYRLILTTPVYLPELTFYKPTHHLRSSSDTSVLNLPSVHTHSLGRRSFSYAAPSVWKLSLARLDHQTHSPLWNIFEISPLKLSYWLCVCVCVCTCLQKFVLTVFCSLLCDGLCAPIWRNSTWKSTLLLFVMCVPKYTHMLRVHLRWNYLQNKGWLNGVCRGVCKSICLTLSQNNPQFCDC